MAVKTKIVDLNKISINKEYSRVSKIHKYWSRKPWYIIHEYINKYSSKGDVVFDPFMGSGSTGLEAILLGRNFIGQDLNPFSLFLTKCTLDIKFDEKVFDNDIRELEKKIKSKIMKLYEVDQELFAIYVLAGPKNNKNYTLVATDYEFKNKVKLNQKVENKKYSKKNIEFPDRPFPKKFYKDRFSYKGVKNVSDMFTDRNLKALSILFHEIGKGDYEYKELLKLSFTNTLLHVSKLKSENIRPLGVNNYWIPDDYIEENVWWRFIDRTKNIKQAKLSTLKRHKDYESITGKYELIKDSALRLKHKAESIDYIFTDPPYGDAIQYSELSYIWNTWLNEEFVNREEVIINPVQNKDSTSFNLQLAEFFNEAYRVLKKDKFLTLCFQNKSIGIWVELAKIIRATGFNLHDIEVFDTLGSPYNKSWAKYSPKSDFYITFKKNGVPPKLKSSISVNKLIANAVKNIDHADFNIGKAYDTFVIELIKASFEYEAFVGADKLNLKTVVNLLQKELNDNGNKQQSLL